MTGEGLALTLDARRRILVAGASQGITVFRWTAQGAVDTSFDGTGYRNVTQNPALSSDGYGIGVAIDRENRIVVAGAAAVGLHKPVVTRLLEDGSFDPVFGGGRQVYTESATAGIEQDLMHTLALRSDGEILTAGIASSAFAPDDYGILLGYDDDGNRDLGITTYDTSAWGWQGMALQSALRMILVGIAVLPDQTGETLVVRTSSVGVIDPGFGEAGGVHLPNAANQSFKVAVLPDDSILVAYQTYLGGVIALYHLSADGEPDPTFGPGGLSSARMPGILAAITLDPAGGFYVLTGEVGGLVIYRFVDGGGLDPTFGTAGIARVATRNGRAFFPEGLALDRDRYLLATGFTRDANFMERPFIVRIWR